MTLNNLLQILASVLAAIVPLCFVGFFIVVVGWILISMNRQAAQNQKILANGVSAKATVINASETGNGIKTGAHQDLELKFQLQIEPKNEPPFAATATRYVSVMDMSRAEQGATALVRYNPADKSQVAIMKLLGPLATRVQAAGQDMQQAVQMVIDTEINADELEMRSVLAPAKILSSQRTGILVAGGAAELTRILLTVQPSNGPSYQAETTAEILIASMQKVAPGQNCTVRFDPQQPSKVGIAKLLG